MSREHGLLYAKLSLFGGLLAWSLAIDAMLLQEVGCHDFGASIDRVPLGTVLASPLLAARGIVTETNKISEI